MPWGLVALILSLFVPSAVVAHPLGIGSGELTFTEDKFRGELVLQKHIDEGQPLSAEARTSELEKLVSQNLEVELDGTAVVLKVKVLALGDATRNVDVVRVSGDVPPGARELRLGAKKNLGELALVVLGPRVKRGARRLLRADRPSKVITLSKTLPNIERTQVADEQASPGEKQAAGRPPASETGIWIDYVVLGFEHVLPDGLDHMLFVLGLFFLCRSIRELVAQLTVFTIAHSLTLLLSSWRIVNLPGVVVEVLIAASIAYVGIERYLPEAARRLRALVVFVFGLLHGMGFASALAGTGFSATGVVLELLAFNLGVEVAQLVVVGGALLLAFWWRDREWYDRRVVSPACVLIGLVGGYWVVERLLM